MKINKAAVEYEVKALEAKLREVTRLDLWERWTYDDEVRLEELRAKLREFEIK